MQEAKIQLHSLMPAASHVQEISYCTGNSTPCLPDFLPQDGKQGVVPFLTTKYFYKHTAPPDLDFATFFPNFET